MRYLKLALLAIIGIVLLTLSLANMQPVTLRLLPEDAATFIGFGYGLTMPLFLVILASVVVGLLIGFIWEWLREHRYRAEAARARTERDRAEARQARAPADEDDDVLALLEDRRRAP